MNINLFKYILALAAMFVAFNAAFFSVTGLSHLFSGAFWSVIVMASSLELGKLVSASFLYRYWNKINIIMKFYLTTGTVILVLITSMGIFGYLSKAYQGATFELEIVSSKMDFYEAEIYRLEQDKEFIKDEMKQSISSLPDNYITAKRQIREEYSPMIFEINSKIAELKPKIGELKQELLKTGLDVGPILYVAKAFDSDIDTVVKYLIFILILVFDPLAVALVIATNVAMAENKIREERKEKDTEADSLTPKSKKEDFNDVDDAWYEEDTKKILESSIKTTPTTTTKETDEVDTNPTSLSKPIKQKKRGGNLPY